MRRDEEYEEQSLSNSSSSSDDDGLDDALVPPPPPSSTSGDRAVRSSSGGRSGSNPRRRAPPSSPFSTPSPASATPPPLRLSSPPLTRLVEYGPAPQEGTGTNATPTGTGTASTAPRAVTPTYSYHDLARRPRSNPRTRTPLRNESPLAPEFRRDSVREEERAAAAAAPAGGRLTVRIGAGSAVGTTGTYRQVTAAQQHQQPDSSRHSHHQQARSTKQGPSRRKVRRWNNDRFVGIAAELARSSTDRNAAEAFLRGEAEAARYLRPNCPLRYRSAFDKLTRTNDNGDDVGAGSSDDDGGGGGGGGCDENDGDGKRMMKKSIDLAAVRDKFVRGETASPPHSKHRRGRAKSAAETRRLEEIFSDGRKMFLRIEPRMRKVVTRAVSTSGSTCSDTFAVRIIDAFEAFLVGCVGNGAGAGAAGGVGAAALLDEILLRPPVVTVKDDASPEEEEGIGSRDGASVVGHFYFDPHAPSGGFHRLLLHAVCQFHGLRASSRTVTVGDSTSTARLLTVTGVCRGNDFRIVDYAAVAATGEGVDGVAAVAGVSSSLVAKEQRRALTGPSVAGNSMGTGVAVGIVVPAVDQLRVS